MTNILKYYNEYGYPSASVLYRIMKLAGEDVSLKEVKNVIDEQLATQLHKKERNKISSHMVAYFENEKWLMDLLDMQNFYKSNGGNRYILIVCDVFTRKGYAIALKNKNADTVLDAFKQIIKNAGQPLKIISDNGSEFLNKYMNKYLNSLSIFHETNDVGYHKALGIIDAFSRTLKNKIYKGFTNNNNSEWVNELPRLVKAYNNSPHRSLLGLSPNEVNMNSGLINEVNVIKNQEARSRSIKFKVGQLVRRKLAKPVFTKGYKQIWSSTTYTIKAIEGVNAILDNDQVVKLNDLQIISKVPASAEEFKDEVKKVERERRIDRNIAKEGIERSEQSLRRSARQRKPEAQLISRKGEKVIWS